MLPGVEVARRRRVRTQGRDLDAYDGGGSSRPEASHRSRSNVTVANHHHHHHHHVQRPRHGSSPSSRPGTPRPGSLVRRMQDVLHEHRVHSSVTSTSSSERGNVVERSSSHVVHHHSSSRVFGHRVAEDSPTAQFYSRWRRQTSSAFSELRGAALEARNRLDERLRAAAHTSNSDDLTSSRFPQGGRSRRNWAAVQSSNHMSYLFSDDEEDNFWSDDDDSWGSSLHEWLEAWAPSAPESWNRASSSSGRPTHNSINRSYKAKPEGLSEAAISALPMDVVGSKINTGKLEQQDCPVCLEGVLLGQLVITLPCKHRFHPECLTPWLSNHGQCPYCRADVVKDSKPSEVKSRTSDGDEDLLSWVEAIERGIDRLSYP